MHESIKTVAFSSVHFAMNSGAASAEGTRTFPQEASGMYLGLILSRGPCQDACGNMPYRNARL